MKVNGADPYLAEGMKDKEVEDAIYNDFMHTFCGETLRHLLSYSQFYNKDNPVRGTRARKCCECKDTAVKKETAQAFWVMERGFKN